MKLKDRRRAGLTRTNSRQWNDVDFDVDVDGSKVSGFAGPRVCTPANELPTSLQQPQHLTVEGRFWVGNASMEVENVVGS